MQISVPGGWVVPVCWKGKRVSPVSAEYVRYNDGAYDGVGLGRQPTNRICAVGSYDYACFSRKMPLAVKCLHALPNCTVNSGGSFIRGVGLAEYSTACYRTPSPHLDWFLIDAEALGLFCIQERKIQGVFRIRSQIKTPFLSIIIRATDLDTICVVLSFGEDELWA